MGDGGGCEGEGKGGGHCERLLGLVEGLLVVVGCCQGLLRMRRFNVEGGVGGWCMVDGGWWMVYTRQ